MHRLSTALLLGVGVLVTTWVSAPASPVAPPVRVSAEDVAHIEALAPIAGAVDQEVARLRAQLTTTPPVPEPARDPFRFGPRRPAPRASTPKASPEEVMPPPSDTEPEVLWPTLAGVMAGNPGQTAVIAWGDSIEFLQAGASFNDFRVVSVSARSIELQHIPTDTKKTLTLH